ncbi:transporter, auxin efflux carrier (AEC) family protein [Hungatella hathewayi DSM 13479]|uniref:Transporter, auxin efflux carrier (AEC) family protein n=2 Tax=Hungatella hathewayi TaxID=154046 RepID=D3AL43_9FIRM|nr:transporter, auxin efflux carrier (AEC) family protein [Hungatella hathewayi DSM 13479]
MAGRGRDMTAVLTKAFAFVAIIAMGYILKRVGFFHAKDFYLISNIVIKITLPAAIVSNFSKITMDYSLLAMCVIGLLCNFVTIAAGYGINIRKSKETRAFAMLNMSGYNIGNFTMPFVQSFLSPVGFAATSLFDAGNSIMCTGMTFTLAGMVVGEDEKPSFSGMTKKLFSSIPFDAYIVMTILSILKLQLPAVMISFADTAGGANAFLALLMLGIGFEVHMDREKIAQIVQILVMRYGIAVLMAVGFYFLAPFGLEVRQTLAIVSLGPVASIAPAFTGALNGDVEMASAVNSLSIIISIAAITAALILLL